MISSYVFTSICLRDGGFGILSIIRCEHMWRLKWPHHVAWLRAAAAEHFQTTLWTLNWHSNLPVACQSWESRLYASKPLAWCLTQQSSVNYPVTDNRAVILQTITQAIRVFWIASSGPESCQRLHSTGAQEGHSPPMTSDDFFLSLFYQLRCASGWLPQCEGGDRGLQSPPLGSGSDSAVLGKEPRLSWLAHSGVLGLCDSLTSLCVMRPWRII